MNRRASEFSKGDLVELPNGHGVGTVERVSGSTVWVDVGGPSSQAGGHRERDLLDYDKGSLKKISKKGRRTAGRKTATDPFKTRVLRMIADELGPIVLSNLETGVTEYLRETPSHTSSSENASLVMTEEGGTYSVNYYLHCEAPSGIAIEAKMESPPGDLLWEKTYDGSRMSLREIGSDIGKKIGYALADLSGDSRYSRRHMRRDDIRSSSDKISEAFRIAADKFEDALSRNNTYDVTKQSYSVDLMLPDKLGVRISNHPKVGQLFVVAQREQFDGKDYVLVHSQGAEEKVWPHGSPRDIADGIVDAAESALDKNRIYLF